MKFSASLIPLEIKAFAEGVSNRITNRIIFLSLSISRSAHYNNLQKQEEEEKLKSSNTNNNNNTSSNNNSNLGPLKDNSNIKSRKSSELVSQSAVNSTSSPSPTPKITIVQKSSADSQSRANHSATSKTVNRKIVPSLSNQNLLPKLSNERPLKCLESLAQQAGVTISESINQHKMEKTQNQPQQVPLQISPEQLQQLQHQFQLQQAFAAGGTAIQVKQEFPQSQANTIEQLNKQIQEQQNQAAQVQQMQLIDAATATSQHQQQNNATMGIKYVNGRND